MEISKGVLYIFLFLPLSLCVRLSLFYLFMNIFFTWPTAKYSWAILWVSSSFFEFLWAFSSILRILIVVLFGFLVFLSNGLILIEFTVPF